MINVQRSTLKRMEINAINGQLVRKHNKWFLDMRVMFKRSQSELYIDAFIEDKLYCVL